MISHEIARDRARSHEIARLDHAAVGRAHVGRSRMALGEQPITEVKADESCGAGNENKHG